MKLLEKILDYLNGRLDQHADVINKKANQTEVDRIQANMEHNVEVINGKADKIHTHNSVWEGQINCYINRNGHWLPGNTAQQLGSTGVRWNYVCLSHSPNVSSDRRLKANIKNDMSKYVDMLEHLKPCTYTITADRDNVKHVGYIAQEVEEALKAAGLSAEDFGGFVYHKEEDNYALRYEEFIPVLHAAVIVLTARVKELEGRLQPTE